jgi:type II secretory pathway pseudopilin PulG
VDVIGIVALVLAAVLFGMLTGVRKRVSRLEDLVLGLKSRATGLEARGTEPAPAASAASAPSAPIDIEPFVE